MSELKKIKLGEICEFQNGYAFKSSDFKENGQYKVIKIKELKNGKVKFFNDSASIDLNIEEYKNYSINKGDVLFALTGDPVNKNNPLSWVGRVSIYEDDRVSLLNQRVCKVVPNGKKILKEYIYYYFRVFDNFYSLAAKATGSASQANISSKTIAETEVVIPTIEYQQIIVRLLSSVDNKINLNNKINDNLEQQVLVLYKNMFMDTEDIYRKGCRIDEYFDISIGKTPPRKEPQWFSNDNSDIIWVSISNMGSCGLYISNSSEYLTRAAIDKHNVKIVPDNTVLLSFKLTVGRVAITNGEMTTNEAIAHFKTDKAEINEYLYCYLKTFNYQIMGSTSSIATAVNSKIIKSMPFIIPNNDELESFHAIAGAMFANIKSNQAEIARLSELRDALLPKLMSGELDVAKINY